MADSDQHAVERRLTDERDEAHRRGHARRACPRCPEPEHAADQREGHVEQREHRAGRSESNALNSSTSVMSSATGTTVSQPGHRALLVLELAAPLDGHARPERRFPLGTGSRASLTNPPMSRPRTFIRMPM